MKECNNFFKTIETLESDIIWYGRKTKKLRKSSVEIRGDEYYLTPELQEVFTNTSGTPIQNLKNEDKVIFSNIPKSSVYKEYPPQPGDLSGRSNYIEHNLDKNVKKILKATAGEIEGHGMKVIIPPTFFDI